MILTLVHPLFLPRRMMKYSWWKVSFAWAFPKIYWFVLALIFLCEHRRCGQMLILIFVCSHFWMHKFHLFIHFGRVLLSDRRNSRQFLNWSLALQYWWKPKEIPSTFNFPARRMLRLFRSFDEISIVRRTWILLFHVIALASRRFLWFGMNNWRFVYLWFILFLFCI